MVSLSELSDKVAKAHQKLGFDQLRYELDDLNKSLNDAELWSDPAKGQNVTRKASQLKGIVEPWAKLKQDIDDLRQLSELGEDVEVQLTEAHQVYKELEVNLRFSGQYDTNAAILTIQSGAGGTDAQDWAQILERMYLRWAEKTGLKFTIVSESPGEIAGIKNATVEISGDPYTYGKLKAEHGVNRLVRISPFNSGGTRETSFAMIEVLPKIDEPAEVDIDDKDLKIDTFRAGGNGGQSVNTTDSAVRITHTPTGVTVSMQNEKSQLQNKAAAMKILASRLAQLKEDQRKEKISELKGPNQEAAWGNQIRNYVMHPYKLVKNADGSFESSDIDGILNGDIDQIVNK